MQSVIYLIRYKISGVLPLFMSATFRFWPFLESTLLRHDPASLLVPPGQPSHIHITLHYEQFLTSKKTKTMTMTMTMTNTFRAFKERSLRLLTFETFDQSDEKTWPDQQKTMRKTMTREHPQSGIFEDILNTLKWQWQWQKKFWVWPYIIVMNSDLSRPNW